MALLPLTDTAYLPQSSAQWRVDWQGLYVSAVASHYCYEAKLDIKACFAKHGFVLDYLFDRYFEGFVARRDDVAIVAFKGSDNTEDWRRNLQALNRKVEYWGQPVEVHVGFWLSQQDLQAQVVDALAGHPGQIVLCGHSLGGAKAVLCALDLMEKHSYSPPTVHTFGQPRIGNKAFVELVGRKLGEGYLRVVNQADVVQTVPTGNKHAGHKLYFNAKGELGDPVELYSAVFEEALAAMPIFQQPISVQMWQDLKAHFEVHKDDLWGDLMRRVEEPMTKVTATWLAFHETERYARVVQRASEMEALNRQSHASALPAGDVRDVMGDKRGGDRTV